MKSFRALIVISMLVSAACAPRHEKMDPQTAAQHERWKSDRQDHVRRMQEMCVQRVSSLGAVLQEVEAARETKNPAQMKAALGKASEDLKEVHGALQIHCENKAGTAHCSCPCGCGTDNCPCMREGKCPGLSAVNDGTACMDNCSCVKEEKCPGCFEGIKKSHH